MSNQQWQPPQPQSPPPSQPPYGQQQQTYMPPQPPMYPPPPSQPHPKRGRLWLIVGIIVVVILAACIGVSTLVLKSSNTGTVIQNSQNSSQNNTPASTPTTAPSSQHFKVGDQVKVGDTWIVTVNSATTSKGSDISTPKSGNIYLVLDVTLKNVSNQEQNVSSIAQFTLEDSTGQKYDETYTDFAKPAPDGKVEAGSPIRGQFVYEVPLSEHHFTFAFEAEIASGGQTIWDITV
jgi:flagellar basal body-associated protein FliL